MIDKTIGNYKFLSEIGEGGMGIVYLAEKLDLSKHYAVKSLKPEYARNPELRRRFSREAKNQAKLRHPNIVEASDFLEHEEHCLLVMEYVDGKGLDRIIEEQGRLSEKEALIIFKDVLKALNHAHLNNMIHRDVKSSNILVDKSGTAKIMDFGISILAGEKRYTQIGAEIGSPCYMSPEQISSPKSIDRRSDVYSIGILLYEMLTGNVPFDGETDYEIMDKHINTPAPDPIRINPNIPKTIANMIFKALEKNPDDRFSDCVEFLECIEAYENGVESASMVLKSSEKEESPQKKGRSGWIVWAFMILAMGIAFLSVYKCK